MPGFEQAVRVGTDRFVHVKSAFQPMETRCGLGGPQAPDLRPTLENPTCTLCKKPERKRAELPSRPVGRGASRRRPNGWNGSGKTRG